LEIRDPRPANLDSMSSPSAHEHRASSPNVVRCAVVTVSDTRTLATDTGGQGVVDRLLQAGHVVAAREIVADDPARLRPLITALAGREDVDAILLTGGTGIAARDQTHETVTALIDKPLPGYGELFRMLSYAEIGAAAMLSRATGGLVGRKVLLTMPGSPAGVAVAMEKVILPELGHLVREARR
jgi:molybdenum cofactor biosynthesis protein B